VALGVTAASAAFTATALSPRWRSAGIRLPLGGEASDSGGRCPQPGPRYPHSRRRKARAVASLRPLCPAAGGGGGSAIATAATATVTADDAAAAAVAAAAATTVAVVATVARVLSATRCGISRR